MTSTIGPEGGTLSSGGVTIIIPPGALAAPRALTLSTAADGVANLAPDTRFDRLVHVVLEPSFFTPSMGAVAWHREPDGDFYRIADLVTEGSEKQWKSMRISPAACLSRRMN